MYRSRIAGNFDSTKFRGTTTARTRADESSLVPSLGFMDIRGIWRKWKEQKRTNQKIENSKKKGTSREFGEIRRRKRTNQKLGIKRKIGTSREFGGNEKKKRTNKKTGNPKKTRKSTENRKT